MVLLFCFESSFGLGVSCGDGDGVNARESDRTSFSVVDEGNIRQMDE